MVSEICRRYGISEATYKWKQKYGGMQVSEARRLRLLEEENRKLKKLVADQALWEEALRSCRRQTRRAAQLCGTKVPFKP